MAGNAGHVSQVIYVKEKYITSYDSVNYDTDSKHNVKYYKEFSLLKLFFLESPLFLFDIHKLERKLREIKK